MNFLFTETTIQCRNFLWMTLKLTKIYRFFITTHIWDVECLLACDTLALHLFCFLFMKTTSKRIEKYLDNLFFLWQKCTSSFSEFLFIPVS